MKGAISEYGLSGANMINQMEAIGIKPKTFRSK